MLPFKKTTGREAFKLIKCYEGIPSKYENAEKIKIKCNESREFITLKELSDYFKK